VIAQRLADDEVVIVLQHATAESEKPDNGVAADRDFCSSTLYLPAFINDLRLGLSRSGTPTGHTVL